MVLNSWKDCILLVFTQWPVWPVEHEKSDGVWWCPRLSYKRYCPFGPCFLDCSFWGEPVTELWGYSSGTLERSGGHLPIASTTLIAMWMSDPLGNGSSNSYQEFCITAALATSNCNLLREPELESWNQGAPEFLSQRNWAISERCKLVGFGATCYTILDKWYIAFNSRYADY